MSDPSVCPKALEMRTAASAQQDCIDQCGIRNDSFRTFFHGAVGLEVQPNGAVQNDHAEADETDKQREWIKQPKQADRRECTAQVAVESKRHAFEQIAEGNAEDQRRTTQPPNSA